MSTIDYIRDAWLRPVVAMTPFVLMCYWAQSHWLPAKLTYFVLQTVVLLPVAVLGAAAVFWKHVPLAWRLLTERQASVAEGRV